jgi:hypothetical protein
MIENCYVTNDKLELCFFQEVMHSYLWFMLNQDVTESNSE